MGEAEKEVSGKKAFTWHYYIESSGCTNIIYSQVANVDTVLHR